MCLGLCALTPKEWGCMNVGALLEQQRLLDEMIPTFAVSPQRAAEVRLTLEAEIQERRWQEAEARAAQTETRMDTSLLETRLTTLTFAELTAELDKYSRPGTLSEPARLAIIGFIEGEIRRRLGISEGDFARFGPEAQRKFRERVNQGWTFDAAVAALGE